MILPFKATMNNSESKFYQPWITILNFFGLNSIVQLTKRLRFPLKIIGTLSNEDGNVNDDGSEKSHF